MSLTPLAAFLKWLLIPFYSLILIILLSHRLLRSGIDKVIPFHVSLFQRQRHSLLTPRLHQIIWRLHNHITVALSGGEDTD